MDAPRPTQPSLLRRLARSDLVWLGLILAAGAAFWLGGGIRAGSAVRIPPPDTHVTAPGSSAANATAAATSATAVFAGGCFWGVQAVFQHLHGVTSAVSGYAGGDAATANYDQVTTGTTGHAESVEVRYDPSVISFADLMHVFFSVAHDPTQLNRQGPDFGPQYRSAVFTLDEEQRRAVAAYIARLDAAKVFGSPIVTEVAPLAGFHAAEDYHQDFATVFPDHPYIVAFDRPKLASLKALFPDRFREAPVLVKQSGAGGRGVVDRGVADRGAVTPPAPARPTTAN